MEQLNNLTEVRSVGEIPPAYRCVFKEYPCFNAVQSQVLDDVLYTDDSVVVSAPTGAGKTAIFELAVVRLLIEYDNVDISQQIKIIYICPIKSLCQERLVDWHAKFAKFGINCVSVTGDSDNVDFQHLVNHNLIISTPEKWDSLTRRWKDNEKIVKVVKLFLIDEVHLLNEENRGSTLEVIVSRMKTVENSMVSCVDKNGRGNQKIRFIALSATVPNVEDIAEWIGKPPNIKYYRFSENMRPVKLKKIVLGYNCNPKTTSPFKFDMSLSYKLQSLMIQHSEGKPTLIFCSTRKSVEMTASHIVRSLKINLTREQTNKLMEAASTIADTKAKDTLKHGVGYHHAGLSPETRYLIESLFRNGDLPVLVTTSTLAMGVNLPAHLVIIKSTKCYDNCGFRDYTETAIHQMIGRAGRPQFDTSATALILTTNDDKHKFEQMVGCGQPIESNLHRHLIEHVNAEVVLRTITDLEVAMQWLSSTFLYVRARKNPHHYGLNVGLSKDQLDRKLLEMCQIDINKLVAGGMITIDQNIAIKPTMSGQIMAKYYVAFETMKLFTQISGTEILIQILALISKCHEFSEMRLRVNDKKTLNLFNKNNNKTTIRFPLNGRIKTWDMKVNCIIQAVLGNLEILDNSLLSESFTIMRNGARIAKCLIEYLGTRRANCYSALLNTIILGKCLQAKLWENSPYVCKQLTGIGNVASNQLVNAGKTSFQKILEANPRDIELCIKRKAPMGNLLIEEVQHIPRYEMTLEKVAYNQKQLKLTISLVNGADLEEKSTVDVKSVMTLLVGNNLNEILLYERYQHSYMMEKYVVIKFIRINTEEGLEEVNAHFISEGWVGVDCSSSVTFTPSDKVASTTTSKEKINENNGTTYIQTFLDMYMKTKAGMGVAQKRQKVKKDDSFKGAKEVTKERKKLVQKTAEIKGKTNQNANINNSGESKKSAENISAVVATEHIENGQFYDEKRHENVAENLRLDEITTLGIDVGTNNRVQPQNAQNDVMIMETMENDMLEEISNVSSASLFSEKIDTILDNNNVNRVHEAVEQMETAEEISHGRDSDENQLVIDEKPEDVLDLNEKVNKALFHLSHKYKMAPHSKKKVKSAAAKKDKSGHKGDTRKRSALDEFKIPNKKKISHNVYSQGLPDLSNDGLDFPMINALQPSNTNKSGARSPAKSRPDVKGDRDKENVPKGITWRSPLVSSPTVKFSPKMSFSGCSTSRDETETDIRNETANETFETTSSKSPTTLTLNILRTPRQGRNTLAFNKKRGTQFPLSDKDYTSNEQESYEDICSTSFIEKLGIDKGSSKTKKADSSPTWNYYSQLLAQPQKQNTDATPQRGQPDTKTYMENVQNKPESCNAWDSSNKWENISQNNSCYLEHMGYHKQSNYLQDVTNTQSSERKQLAKKHFDDINMAHHTLTLSEEAALNRSQNTEHKDRSQSNEFLAVRNFNPWDSDYQCSENSGADYPYHVEPLPRTSANFVPPITVGDANLPAYTSHPPRRPNETFVSHNYPGEHETLNASFPVPNISQGSENFPEHLNPQNVPHTIPMGLVVPGNNFQNRHSSEYFGNNFRTPASQFAHCGTMRSSHSEFIDYGALQESQPQQKLRQSASNEKYFRQSLHKPTRKDAVSQMESENFVQYGLHMGESALEHSQDRRSRINKSTARDKVHNRSFQMLGNNHNQGKSTARDNVYDRSIIPSNNHNHGVSATRDKAHDRSLPMLDNNHDYNENTTQDNAHDISFSILRNTQNHGESNVQDNVHDSSLPTQDSNQTHDESTARGDGHDRSFTMLRNIQSHSERTTRVNTHDSSFSMLRNTQNCTVQDNIHDRSRHPMQGTNHTYGESTAQGNGHDRSYPLLANTFNHCESGAQDDGLRYFANRPNGYMAPMMNMSFPFEQPSGNIIVPQPEVYNAYHRQQEAMNNSFVMRNLEYQNYCGLPQQNFYHPNNFIRGIPAPYYFNNGVNIPYVQQYPPYGINYTEPRIPEENKQFMMNKFLKSMGPKK